MRFFRINIFCLLIFGCFIAKSEDISYPKKLKKYGCVNGDNDLFLSDLFTEEEKSFLIKNIPKKIKHFISSGVSRETTMANLRKAKKVSLTRCGVNVSIPSNTFKPNYFVTFDPASIAPICKDSNQKKDSSCDRWFEETMNDIQEKLNGKKINLPLNIIFEGHTNSITDDAFWKMTRSAKNCKNNGIFKDLNLCRKIKGSLRGCKKIENCSPQLNLLKEEYLDKLSKKRADVLKEKFKEKSKKRDVDIKIVSEEIKEKRVSLFEQYIELEGERAKILSDLVNDTSNKEDIEAELDNCFNLSDKPLESDPVISKNKEFGERFLARFLDSENNYYQRQAKKRKPVESCKEKFINKDKVVRKYIEIDALVSDLKKNFEQEGDMITLGKSLGRGDSQKKVSSIGLDDQKDRRNQRVEVIGKSPKIDASKAWSEGISIPSDLESEELICNINQVNEDRITTKDQKHIDNILKKISKKDFENDTVKYHMGGDGVSSKFILEGSNEREKIEECSEFKEEFEREDRKYVESGVARGIINFAFFGSKKSNCQGSQKMKGKAEGTLSFLEEKRPHYAAFDVTLPKGSKGFSEVSCRTISRGINGVHEYVKNFNLMLPETWEKSIGKMNPDKFKCTCMKNYTKEKNECSVRDALKGILPFFKTPMGQKMIRMEKELKKNLQGKTNEGSKEWDAVDLDEIEKVFSFYESCINKYVKRRKSKEVSQALDAIRNALDKPHGGHGEVQRSQKGSHSAKER